MGFAGSAFSSLALLTAVAAFFAPIWLAIGLDASANVADGIEAIGSATIAHGLFSGFNVIKNDVENNIILETILEDEDSVDGFAQLVFPFEQTEDGEKVFSTPWRIAQAAGIISIVLGVVALALGCRADNGPGRVAALFMSLASAVAWIAYIVSDEVDAAEQRCEDVDSFVGGLIGFGKCEVSPTTFTYDEGTVVVFPYFAGFGLAVVTTAFSFLAAICG